MDQIYAYVVDNINRAITQVRTSIVSVHLHEKQIAYTLASFYFLYRYHLCRIRIVSESGRKKIFESESEKNFSDPQRCKISIVLTLDRKSRLFFFFFLNGIFFLAPALSTYSNGAPTWTNLSSATIASRTESWR
jgi:hypothetical protein